MIMDEVPIKTVWNVYLDMYLDEEAHAAFAAQCRRLVKLSETMEAWHGSSYASTLRMGTDLTLGEVRRHWSLYLAAATAVDNRAATIRQLMDNGRRKVFEEFYKNTNGTVTLSTARSAGPLFLSASPVYTEHLRQYWRTGTTSFPAVESATKSHVNPTFLYSKAGEIFAMHHGVDPLGPFHLSHVFGNHHGTPTPRQLTASALEELHNWCDAFRARAVAGADQLAVRFIFGDVLAVSQALQARNEHGDFLPGTNLAAPWTSEVLQLSAFEYDSSRAPTRFDVVDTSNICDHIGLVNVLLSSVPLLTESSPASGVLYTESLIAAHDDSDPVEQLQAMLVTDLATHSLLFGVAPLGALSGFTSQCDTHELLQRLAREEIAQGQRTPGQHLQMITWRRPWTADRRAATATRSPALIELSPAQLCPLLFRIYNRLFGAENPIDPVEVVRGVRLQPTGVPYTRETFILLLCFLRPRLCLSEAQWSETLNNFVQLQRSTAMTRNMFDGLSHREFNTLLYRARILDMPGFGMCSRPRSGRLSHWTIMPPLVRIYLVVPADKLAVLRRPTNEFPTPPLHCAVNYARWEHISQSVHAVFGRVVDVGTPSDPVVAVQTESESLFSTTSPLVLSFVIPTATITDDAAPGSVSIRLSLRTNPATVKVFARVLGPSLSIFSANLEDAQHVHVVPESCLPPPPPLSSLAPIVPGTGPDDIGGQCPVHVELGEQEAVATLTARLLVENAKAKAAFSGDTRASPIITQTSPCTMRVALGSQVQHLVYPTPIAGSQHKARLARKSSYIEVCYITLWFPVLPLYSRWSCVQVVVPVAIPALGNPDGVKLDPFPVVRSGDALAAWNMHRVNLDQLPMLDTKNPALANWFNTHVSAHFSDREGKMKRREANMTPDTLTYLKDTIHYMLNKVAGLGGPAKRVFALRDDSTNDSDTIFFVRGLRYDLSCHTVVCDAYVLPLFPELMVTLEPWFADLVRSQIPNTRTYEGESAAWKQLLPAIVERCRASWTHSANCEYVAKGTIPLSTELNGGDPLCSCGRGKDVEGMGEEPLWRPFAPFVTRIALSPLFAVSYIEPVIPFAARTWLPMDPGFAPSPSSSGLRPARGPHQCDRCGKTGPDNKKCGRCGMVKYCSKDCQRADWKSHKLACATVTRAQ